MRKKELEEEEVHESIGETAIRPPPARAHACNRDALFLIKALPPMFDAARDPIQIQNISADIWA